MKGIYIILALILLITSVSCTIPSEDSTKPLSKYTNVELEVEIEQLYKMNAGGWAKRRIIIYQNELILRKLEKSSS